MKNFGVTFDYVLNEMPYVNLIMYNRTLPDYDFDKDKNDNGGGRSYKSKGRNLLEMDDAEWETLLK